MIGEGRGVKKIHIGGGDRKTVVVKLTNQVSSHIERITWQRGFLINSMYSRSYGQGSLHRLERWVVVPTVGQ